MLRSRYRLGYGLDGPVSYLAEARDFLFSKTFQTSSGARPPPKPNQWILGSYRVNKRPNLQLNDSFPSSAEVKSEWSCSSPPPTCIQGMDSDMCTLLSLLIRRYRALACWRCVYGSRLKSGWCLDWYVVLCRHFAGLSSVWCGLSSVLGGLSSVWRGLSSVWCGLSSVLGGPSSVWRGLSVDGRIQQPRVNLIWLFVLFLSVLRQRTEW